MVAAIIAAADDALYLILIRSQGTSPDDRGRVVFVATFLAGAVTVALAAALLTRPKARTVLLGVATGALFAVGALAVSSIGLPLLVAGVLTTIAWTRSADADQPGNGAALSVGFALAAAGLLIVGIVLT
jgi:hypothetical protein